MYERITIQYRHTSIMHAQEELSLISTDLFLKFERGVSHLSAER